MNATPAALRTTGAVMPIGGAEERSQHGAILKSFVDLCGREDARIVVLPSASEDPTAGNDYVDIFHRLGVRTVDNVRIDSREAANAGQSLSMLQQATGVFISGGDQARLNALVVGTKFAELLRDRNATERLTVAGTSAGASLLSMLVMSGGESEAPPYKGMVDIVAGFGLLTDVVIDQHFNSRGRIGRLLATFSACPGLIAFGIDENTALIFKDGVAKAIGEQSVIVLDGRDIYSDYGDRSDGDLLTITNARIHVLAPGRMFDLERREVLYFIQEQTRTEMEAAG
jgi:cyanophycinase